MLKTNCAGAGKMSGYTLGQLYLRRAQIIKKSPKKCVTTKTICSSPIINTIMFHKSITQLVRIFCAQICFKKLSFHCSFHRSISFSFCSRPLINQSCWSIRSLKINGTHTRIIHRLPRHRTDTHHHHPHTHRRIHPRLLQLISTR